MFFIIIIFLILATVIVGGTVYSLNLENKKMTTKDKAPSDNNSESYIQVQYD